MNRAEGYARTAARWIKDNPASFQVLTDLMCSAHKAGAILTRDMAYYEAARRGIEVTVCRDIFKRDHNMWAVLTRYAVMLRPWLSHTISFRSSVFDELDLASIYEEEGCTEPLLVDSLDEAWQWGEEE